MESENLLVGMLLRGSASLGDVLALGLSPTDFADSRCQAVFAAMIEADRLGEPCDLPSIGARKPGLAAWLVQVSDEAPSASAPGFYVSEVIAAAWARQGTADLPGVDCLRRTRHAGRADPAQRGVAVRGGTAGRHEALNTSPEHRP